MEVFGRKSFQVLFSLFTLFLLVACGEAEQAGSLTKSTAFECIGQEVKGQYLVEWRDGNISVEYAESDEKFISSFLEKNKTEIEFAEPDYRIQHHDIGVLPADSSDAEPNWGVYNIKADTVWNSNIQGDDVIVAVTDSGVDINHPQLQKQIALNLVEKAGKVGVDDDGNGLIDDIAGWNFLTNSGIVVDESGHGTHVSGIIAADHSSEEVLGVAPKAKILPVDFMDRNGGTTSAAIASLNYAVSRGAKVINASWGGSYCSKSLMKTFENLSTQNVLIVVAAGNGDAYGNGRDLSYYPEFPARFHVANQINVAALDPSGYRASFSNYGTPVDLLAPGVLIQSTIPTNLSYSGYGVMSGTSMAAPFVSGVAALMWSKNPAATAAQIKQAILSSLDNLVHNVTPRGKLRADKAVNAL